MDSQIEPLDTLTGKLKSLCPTLYDSLTLWERDALDNSGWLKRTTSRDPSPSEVDKSFSALEAQECARKEPKCLDTVKDYEN
jgi:hypothetical protein